MSCRTWVAFLSFIAVLAVATKPGRAQDTTGCFYLHTDSIQLNPVLFRATRDTTILITVRDSGLSPLILSIVGPDAAAFQSLTPFPMTVTAGQFTVRVRFRPMKPGFAVAQLVFRDSLSTCVPKYAGLLGVALDTTSDADTLDFIRLRPEAFAFISTRDTTERRMRLRNNSAEALQVTSVSMVRGRTFFVSDVPALPVTVGPGELFEFNVALSTADSGFYEDQLLVLTSHELAEEYTSVQAYREARKAAVREQEVTPGVVRLVREGNHIAIVDAPYIVTTVTLYDIAGRRVPLVWLGNNIWRFTSRPVPGVYHVLLQGGTRRIAVKFMVDR